MLTNQYFYLEININKTYSSCDSRIKVLKFRLVYDNMDTGQDTMKN